MADGALGIIAICAMCAVAFIEIVWYADREAQRDADANVMDCWLCESKSYVLRIGQLYRFRPDPNCKTCMRMKREHDKAYCLNGENGNG